MTGNDAWLYDADATNCIPAGYSVHNRTAVIKFVHFQFVFMIAFVSHSYHVKFDHFVFCNKTACALFVSCKWRTLDLNLHPYHSVLE
jgi:hypothetical protein